MSLHYVIYKILIFTFRCLLNSFDCVEYNPTWNLCQSYYQWRNQRGIVARDGSPLHSMTLIFMQNTTMTSPENRFVSQSQGFVPPPSRTLWIHHSNIESTPDEIQPWPTPCIDNTTHVFQHSEKCRTTWNQVAMTYVSCYNGFLLAEWLP